MASSQQQHHHSYFLVNPANPSLTGVSKFPYFPRGGPQPKDQPQKDAHHIMGYVTKWGGMEVGQGMLFSMNVVDGMVHTLGGWKLAMECKMKGPCEEGQAVLTSAGGEELRDHYDKIIHTVPPFYEHHVSTKEHSTPEECLALCYRNSIDMAEEEACTRNENVFIAFPLMGAGCRGFPIDPAVEVAAQQTAEWLRQEQSSSLSAFPLTTTLAFGIPESEKANTLINAIEEKMILS